MAKTKQDMLERANRNKESSNITNVSFVESEITNVNLPAATADCIISNCVVNLVPEAEKQRAFNEMARLLKPGGRVAISDILVRKELTPALKESIALYVGCVAGASHVESYKKYFKEAGFSGKLRLSFSTDGFGSNECLSRRLDRRHQQRPEHLRLGQGGRRGRAMLRADRDEAGTVVVVLSSAAKGGEDILLPTKGARVHRQDQGGIQGRGL